MRAPGRIGLTAIAVLAVALAVAPAAGANVKKIPTRVALTLVGYDEAGDSGYYIAGEIKSANRTCRRGRRLSLGYEGGVTAKSTAEGVFAFDLPDNEQTASDYPFFGGNYTATLPRKRFGHRKHRKLCKPDSAVFTVNDIPGTSGVEENNFDDGTNTFSGDIDIASPCDGNRAWDLYSTADNTNFVDLSDGDPGTDGNQRVPLEASGEWSFTLSTEPGDGLEYDAYVYERLTYDASGDDLSLRQCGSIDTVDYVAPS